MKIVKIFTLVAVLITTALIIACCIVENPLDTQYEQTLECIMEKEQLHTEKAALIAYPSLVTAKLQIAKIKKYQCELNEYQRSGQAPIGVEKSQDLSNKINQIRTTEESLIQSLRSLRVGV